MRSRSLLAAAVVGLSTAALGGPLDYHLDDVWRDSGITKAKRPPRKHSSHKQNARKQRKRR